MRFFCLRPYLPLNAEVFLWQLAKSGIRGIPRKHLVYQRLHKEEFRSRLIDCLQKYHPMVATVRSLSYNPPEELDICAFRQNRVVRPTGWFDAQFTVFSEAAAHFFLPYDNQLSGWWSAQYPIILLSHLAFGERSLFFLDIGVRNKNHGGYRPDYDGPTDVRRMCQWLAPAIKTDLRFSLLEKDGVCKSFVRS